MLSTESKQPSSARRPEAPPIATVCTDAPVVLSITFSELTSPTKRLAPTTSRQSGPDASLFTAAPATARQDGSTGPPGVVLQPVKLFLSWTTSAFDVVSNTSTDWLVRSVT